MTATTEQKTPKPLRVIADTSAEDAERIDDATGIGEIQASADEAGKPEIAVPGDEVTISKAAQALYLAARDKGSLYARGKSVVVLARNTLGQQVLEPLRPSAARSKFEEVARFIQWRRTKGGSLVAAPTILKEDIARAILDSRFGAEILHPINIISSCPVLLEREGKLVVLGEGFDPASGILVTHGGQPETVPIGEAVRALRELLSGFHFQTPGDEARAVAALIAPGMKAGSFIKGRLPVDVAEADKSQSGKTYRVKLVAAIYGETQSIVPLRRGGVGSLDESLSERLIAGRPFIAFDNFRGRLDSPTLEAFLTADGPFPCRVPHSREIEVDPSRFYIALSSNGVEFPRDMANRSSVVRIFNRPGVAFPDWLGIVRAKQPYYLGCVHAVIRTWYEHGKQQTGDVRHHFRDWNQKMDWIVQNIFGCCPLMDGHQEIQETTSSPTLVFVRKLGIAVEADGRLGLPLKASDILEISETHDIEIPGADGIKGNEDRLKRLIGTKLKAAFAKTDSLKVGAYNMNRDEKPVEREGRSDPYPAKVYTFTRREPLLEGLDDNSDNASEE